jgi:FeS assembly protein IscX
MAKMKLKWTNTEDLAFRLIDEYPSLDPRSVKLSEIQKYITKLPEFSDDPKKGKEAILEEIQNRWFEERSDMEDELGPMDSAPLANDDDLDEDDYRDDTFAADDAEVALLGDEDEEDEDEFGDGFQEEEAEEK